MKKDREYRAFGGIELRAEGEGMVVRGIPVVFDSPTVMYEHDGIEYKEVISRGAFDGADMSDVIMNYNHGGKVVARLRNQTLRLNITDQQAEIEADLGGTQEGRSLYEEIKGGYIDKMSFAFTVAEESYDNQNRTRYIKRIKKLYDVSAVDIPAYEQTSISARSFYEVEHSKEQTLEQDRLRNEILLKTKL